MVALSSPETIQKHETETKVVAQNQSFGELAVFVSYVEEATLAHVLTTTTKEYYIANG